VREILLALVALVLLPACLTNQYEISGSELARLAELPPGERGERIRVTQQTGWGRDDVVQPTVNAPIAFVHRTGRPHRRRFTVEDSDGDDGGDGAAKAVGAAVAVVALAGATMLVVAPTEGQRYDGWVRVDEAERVLVFSDVEGPYETSLADLSVEQASSAHRALVFDQGALRRLGRAPLDRRGFTFTLEGGAAQLVTRNGTRDVGFQSRLGLGAFFTRQLGLLVGGQFAAGDQAGTVFNGRLFLEADVLPLDLGKVHLGAYGEGGAAMLMHDGPDGTERGDGLYLGGGALTQLELSTRLALSLRLGVAMMPLLPGTGGASGGHALVPEASIGFAVY
jgi:hypothetical protein